MNHYYIIALVVVGLLLLLGFLPKPDHRKKYRGDTPTHLASGERVIFDGEVKHWQVSNPMFESFQRKSTSPRGKYVILTNRRFLGFTKTLSFSKSGYEIHFGAVFQKPKDTINWFDTSSYWSGLYGIAGEPEIVSIESLTKDEENNRVTFHTVRSLAYKLHLYGVDDKVIEEWKQALCN